MDNALFPLVLGTMSPMFMARASASFQPTSFPLPIPGEMRLQCTWMAHGVCTAAPALQASDLLHKPQPFYLVTSVKVITAPSITFSNVRKGWMRSRYHCLDDLNFDFLGASGRHRLHVYTSVVSRQVATCGPRPPDVVVSVYYLVTAG